jgi:flavin reductase (DIM6/NTAB) family NADH-FMN oxidoreductase RutF
MEELIFAYFSDGLNPKDLMLGASIREFAGSLSDNPIWVLIPKEKNQIPIEMKNIFLSLNVNLIPFSIENEPDFPFIDHVLAAATAESLAKDNTALLAWLGSKTIIFNEPNQFLLDKEITLGYRPVHHTNVGSFYDEPIDPFWKLVYEKCSVSGDKIFPMKTHVDHNKLRPYFNAGCLVVRPERSLMQSWWTEYKKLHDHHSFKEFYEKNYLYSIFIHQAILSGVILSTFERKELRELPFTYNYPLNLYYQCPIAYRAENINELITVRYEDPQDFKNAPIQDPYKGWFLDHMDSYYLKIISSNQKVKIGKIPFVYPIPIILAGALVNGKPNFETLGDVGIMGINPPIVYISSNQDHHTNKGILEYGSFSINIPSIELLTKTDYCGIVSGKDKDKSQLFNVFYGELETAPMIRECPVNLECKVIKEFSIQHRQIFIGDAIQTHVNKNFIIEDKDHQKVVDMTKLNPIIYGLDNHYYKIGDIIGVGYQEGRKLIKK